MELRMDSRCVWTMPEHDQHALKLAKGTEGSREDRDWLFGELCGSLTLVFFQADEQIKTGFFRPTAITPRRTEPPQGHMSDVS